MFQKLRETPPPLNTVFLFFLILLNFKKATILHYYFIYLYLRISLACILYRNWYIIRTFSINTYIPITSTYHIKLQSKVFSLLVLLIITLVIPRRKAISDVCRLATLLCVHIILSIGMFVHMALSETRAHLPTRSYLAFLTK